MSHVPGGHAQNRRVAQKAHARELSLRHRDSAHATHVQSRDREGEPGGRQATTVDRQVVLQVGKPAADVTSGRTLPR